MRAVLGRTRSRFAFTEAEGRLLDAALVSTSRDHLAMRLGITANTVKKHVSAILGKTGAESFEDFVTTLRAELLGG